MIGRRTPVRRIGATLLVVLVAALCGCAHLVDGAATWPGTRLERSILTAADFPAGVQYERIVERPGQPDGQGAPPAMLSRPDGCSDGLTRVIAASAERGAGSALKYVVSYDGVRMLVTVASWQLDLEEVTAMADRCAQYRAYFEPSDDGIPISTTPIQTTLPGALAYRQTMRLGTVENSVYFSFENVGNSAVFGVAFPTPNPTIAVKATLPQTFLDIMARQADRLAVS
jgi:hypothetical protein